MKTKSEVITHLDLMKTKSEVITQLDTFIKMAERQTGLKLQRLRSDRGGEYCSDAMKEYCKARGIIHELTAPYSPAQNGVAERRQRTLVESARCMLHAAKLPPSFWSEALLTAAYVGNLSPTSALHGATPYEQWFNAKPDVSHLRVFGCLAYALLPDSKRQKMDPKSKPYTFIGYADNSKAYRLYDNETGTIVERRDVVFSERELGSLVLTSPQQRDSVLHLFDVLNEDNSSFPTNATRHEESGHQISAKEVIIPTETLVNHSDEPAPKLPAGAFEKDSACGGDNPVPINDCQTSHCHEEGALRDHPDSLQQPLVPPSDKPSSPTPGPAPGIQQVPPSRIPFFKRRLHQEDSIFSMANHIGNSSSPTEPKTIEEALSGPDAAEWNAAIVSEMASMGAT